MIKSIFSSLVIISLFYFGNFSPLFPQEDRVTWHRSEPTEELKVELFRSPQVINLPTSTTLKQGDLEFEISHRFVPTIKNGSKDLWGFDGPVNMRIALGYALTDDLLIALGRSNLNDNIDFSFKYNPLQIRSDLLPALVSIKGGFAWNGDVPNRSSGHHQNFQYYGQLIINTMLDKKLGAGIVPSYLYNSSYYIPNEDNQYSFTLGTYLNYYLNDMWGVMFEWNPTVIGYRINNNPVAFGFELNTGGHFFKIVLTNSDMLNPSQFLAGSRSSFNNGEWHIGFNITRLLRF